jgi:hypothetical protein
LLECNGELEVPVILMVSILVLLDLPGKALTNVVDFREVFFSDAKASSFILIFIGSSGEE